MLERSGLDLQAYLEQFREASDYIKTRIQSVHVLHNFSVALAGGTGATISVLAALATLSRSPTQGAVTAFGSNLPGLDTFAPLLLVGPWVLVPSGLMILRNHMYIDIAERYIEDVLSPRINDILRRPGCSDPPLSRVYFTRQGILRNRRLSARLFIGILALSEYAIPLAMSALLLLGFWNLVDDATKAVRGYGGFLASLDAALILSLVIAVVIGRGIRPHENAFDKAVDGKGRWKAFLLSLRSALSPWPPGKPPGSA